MADVWFCYEGRGPTIGGPAYQLSQAACRDKLGLSPLHFLQDLETEPRPRFGDPNTPRNWKAGFKHVVVELSTEDVDGSNWRPGYYYLDLSLGDLSERLGRRR